MRHTVSTLLLISVLATTAGISACARNPKPAPVDKTATPADPADPGDGPAASAADLAGAPLTAEGTLDREALRQLTHLDALKARSWDGSNFKWGAALPADASLGMTPAVDAVNPVPDVAIQPAKRTLDPPAPPEVPEEPKEATSETSREEERNKQSGGAAGRPEREKPASAKPPPPPDNVTPQPIPKGRDEVETREFTYEAEGLTLTGYGAVPKGEENPPTIILIHGLIPVDRYTTADLRREAEYFASRGIAGLVPDMRGYRNAPKPEANPEINRLGGLRDVVNLIQALRTSSNTGVDPNRLGVWGHGHGGALALKVSYLTTVAGTFVVAPTGVQEALDYELFETQMAPEIAKGMAALYGPPGPETSTWYKDMTVTNYLDRFTAPLGFVSGALDPITPADWTTTMMMILSKTSLQSMHAAFPYTGHTFHGSDWLALMQSNTDFFKQRFQIK